jgi:hypothetical protein
MTDLVKAVHDYQSSPQGYVTGLVVDLESTLRMLFDATADVRTRDCVAREYPALSENCRSKLERILSMIRPMKDAA